MFFIKGRMFESWSRVREQNVGGLKKEGHFLEDSLFLKIFYLFSDS